MKNSLPLQEDKKLSVTYRIEPGCLGPEGDSHVDEFCEFAKLKLQSLDSDYVIWKIKPRRDKTLAEMQYCVLGKKINHNQADQYLAVFNKSLDEFEGHLNDNLAALINEFMGH